MLHESAVTSLYVLGPGLAVLHIPTMVLLDVLPLKQSGTKPSIISSGCKITCAGVWGWIAIPSSLVRAFSFIWEGPTRLLNHTFMASSLLRMLGETTAILKGIESPGKRIILHMKNLNSMIVIPLKMRRKQWNLQLPLTMWLALLLTYS
jgi:hypothetical protein